MNMVKHHNLRAIQFFLKTQAGWAEKNQLEVTAVKTDDPDMVDIKKASTHFRLGTGV